MVFSYNWLQSFFKKRLPKPEKLAELLTIYSFEVKEVKKVGKDFILDIDVLPNRGPDCFSHLGIAREISIITGYPLPVTGYALKEDKKLKARDFLAVEVKEKTACPRYTTRIISGVRVGPSPKWIQERLKVCGLQPINNIVDIANYVMLETGQPLHAFDLEKLEADERGSKPRRRTFGSLRGRRGLTRIIVRFAQERERIVTLDEKTYELSPEILVIADAKKPVAIAGIKGGIMPKIDKKTKIIVLESANFNPKIIRRGSRKLNLKTDASLRFEHGIDPNLTEFAINRAAFLVHKNAGGKIAQSIVDFYPRKLFSKKIILDLDYVNKLMGLEISKSEIKDILKKLNFKVTETRSRGLPKAGGGRGGRSLSKVNEILVTVPTFRLDISLSEDLIEEISRIYGFQKIPACPPLASLIPPERNFSRFWEDFIKDTLKEAGFSEVYNYSFIGEKDYNPPATLPLAKGERAPTKIFGFEPKDLLEIENPVSENQKYLRPSLIPNLLKNVKENKENFKEIKIFELGKIFKKSLTGKISEKKALTGLMVRFRSPSTLSLSNGLIFKKEKIETFYELKGVCDLILEKMGISNVWYDTYQATPEESKISFWHPKKCAEIKVDHQEIGFLGEISPKISENLGMIENVVVFDFDFEKLQKLVSEEHEFRPLSKYPTAIRDLAVLVPSEVKVEEVLNEIEIAGGILVRDVDLFDIYEGEELPTGKKNLAFHIIYQAEDRTLSSEEIDEIQQKIIEALEKNPGWQVRR